jgi:hypothetical protein
VEKQAVTQRLEAAPPEGGVRSLRGLDAQKFIEIPFGKLMSLSAAYDLLHELGDEWLVPPLATASIQTSQVRSRRGGCSQKQVPEELAKIQATHHDNPVVVVFQDNCGFGRRGTLTRAWAGRGSRPTRRVNSLATDCTASRNVPVSSPTWDC